MSNMKKPKAFCARDSFSEKPDDGWIFIKIEDNFAVKVEYQGCLETKDVYLTALDAERLGKELIKFSKWLKGGKNRK